MSIKDFVLCGLILCCCYQSNAFAITEKVFCSYNAGDWADRVEYDEKSDTIHYSRCAWGWGWECDENNIPKIMDQDDIQVYCDDEHTGIFINDNGNWRWENPGCILHDKPHSEYPTAAEQIAANFDGYAFTYVCPYNTSKQLLVIDKKEKIYVINCKNKTFRVFSDTDNPIIYPNNSDNPLHIDEKVCEN